ncbi:MAG: hypothetical protein H6605_06990 [Flavobacteriales bacterium]|nr:hypothetical protein [Flavobacteriales bacterium]
MKKLLFSTIILLVFICSNAQTNSSEVFNSNRKKHYLHIKDTSSIYVNDGDSTELFYYALAPQGEIKGVLIILPSTWEVAEDAFNNNLKLASIASDSGIMTVVPSINFNLCMDQTAIGFLNITFRDVFEKYKAPMDKVVIGGFSLGGMNAIRYTEFAHQDSVNTYIKPKAVYGIDPPVDFINLYYSFIRTAKKNMSAAAVGEANSYLERMEAQFGDNPEVHPEKYIYYSMYSHNQIEGGNAKYLRNIPIRIYSDPDIDWHLRNRNVDLYDMNALDQTAMINDLHQMGNNRAEFINALGKGIRPNGMRHPHSRSIAEPVECLHWIQECIK